MDTFSLLTVRFLVSSHPSPRSRVLDASHSELVLLNSILTFQDFGKFEALSKM